MTHIYQQYLDEIVAWHKQRGRVGGVQSPCSPEAAERLRFEARVELSCDLSGEYIDFLRITNGVEWNGLHIYASETSPLAGYEDRNDMYIQGFVDANLDWRAYEPHRDYLYFANSGISLYAYNLVESRYEIQDQSSMDVAEVLPSFDHLIASALRDHRP
jgi:hypothetical protein